MGLKASMQVVLLILIVQVFYSLLSPFLKEEDRFPLHRWALFARVEKQLVLPVVYIRSLDSRVFDPPLLSYDYFDNRRDIDFLAAFDHLRFWNYRRQEARHDEAEGLRKRAEKHLFTGYKAEYEIRVLKVDPRAFRQKGEVIEHLHTAGPYIFEGRQ